MKKLFLFLFLSFFINDFSSAHSLSESINSNHRVEKNILRDKYRNPYETLSFFRIQPEMTVVELSPGRGWYTEILAMLMYDKGRYIVAPYNPNLGGYAERLWKSYNEFLKSNDIYSKVETTFLFDKLAEDNSVDAVLTFRNVHNWINNNDENAKKIFKQSFSALRSGGYFGIVEHRANKETSLEDMYKSGYMTEKFVIDLAKNAGFLLIDKSEINSNSKDLKNYPKGVWTLPPSLRLKDEDKSKYLEIGESDRMTLLFQKP
ncbi:MAG: class I SAM-dependent methyltransferase [Alphaproteobacteria bacterium]